MRVDHEQGATFVELFFDLVFVYAVTQLTSLVLHDLTWAGVGEALLLFWLVWWSWTQFTWTLNSADTEHVLVRLPVLAATAVAFFLAQGVPDAFGSAGPWFAISYVVVRIIGLALQALVYPSEDTETPALGTWTAVSSLGLVLVLVGGFAHGDARVGFWAAAVVADVLAAALAGRGTWEIAGGHFVERHGLIVIIALGESLIAAGVATSELERDALFAVTTAGAVVATCALWWTYFGVLHGRLEEAMHATSDHERAPFARDVFSFGHAVIVAGVIGIAVGFEEAIAHPEAPLHLDAALALTGGVAAFVGGLTASARRAGIDHASGVRLAFVVLVLAVTPLVPQVSPTVALWGLAASVTALAVHESRGGQRGGVVTAPVPNAGGTGTPS